MRTEVIRFATAFLFATLCAPMSVHATDVDGPDDCQRPARDYGDAPEGIDAYPGVPGRFPTCAFAGPVGTRTLPPGCIPISTVPGPTGVVTIQHGLGSYWLGCFAAGPFGIDTDPDGKVSLGGGPSACGGNPVDCTETFWATYGQDECYGSTDACLASPLTFGLCSPNTFTFTTANCGPPRQVVLNILVDWNQDGDWNDVVQCPNGCVYEWAIKNLVIGIPNGCGSYTATVNSGPNPGNAWMRIALTDNPVSDDFPWDGTGPAGNIVTGGEVEDYPVRIAGSSNCPIQYSDFGDAPEAATAYPSGVTGFFPTCLFPSGAAPTVSAACPPGSSGLPVGYVQHITVAGQDPFWIGCVAPPFVDSEPNGKTSSLGGAMNVCDPAVGFDCTETAFGGFLIGQDECAGDGVDAGVLGPFKFSACTNASIEFNAYNCATNQQSAFLNVLVDWNEDGDWLDNFQCPGALGCAYEWAVQNAPITLAPGCLLYSSPTFLTGPNGGFGWMRVSLSSDPAPPDFPWNGTVSLPGSAFRLGETEDYPVEINGPQNGCNIDYRDFGDAPEGFAAYPSGVVGFFPTCNAAFPPGDRDVLVCPPTSTPPGPTGRVVHLGLASDPFHFWFGCTAVPPGSIDGEPDGKTSPGGGAVSFCDQATPVDCVEAAFGGVMSFGQDECYADADAGLDSPPSFRVCETSQFRYRLFNCSQQDLTVIVNVLVDWNQDGDWNDVLQCPGPVCTPEWAVKNLVVTLVPGCNILTTPLFRVGPVPGPAWMRISASLDPAPDDYPWNGSGSIPGGVFRGGETEDYPVVIQQGTTGVDVHEGGSGLFLAAPEPNPSSEDVALKFGLSRRGPVSLAVYDLAGRRVVGLASGVMSAGPHAVRWNHRDASGRTVPLGMYMVRLEAEGRVMTQRIVRIR